MTFTRFLLLSDLHGNVNGLKKLYNSRKNHFSKIDAIIISGDFPVTTPLSLILHYMIKNRNLSRIGYSKDVYWNELREKFVHHQIQSIKKMIGILQKFNKPMIYIPGNIETRESVEFIKQNFSDVINIDNSVYKFQNQMNLFGLGGSLDHLGVVCDHEFEVPAFNKKVHDLRSLMLNDAEPNVPQVIISHEPPQTSRSQIEIKELIKKARNRGYSYEFKKTYGSKELKKVISEMTPTLTINGHYHEYPGLQYINNSPVINPGAFATYNYAIVAIAKNNPFEVKVNFYKILPNFFSFTNFLYQKRSFTTTEIQLHG